MNCPRHKEQIRVPTTAANILESRGLSTGEFSIFPLSQPVLIFQRICMSSRIRKYPAYRSAPLPDGAYFHPVISGAWPYIQSVSDQWMEFPTCTVILNADEISRPECDYAQFKSLACSMLNFGAASQAANRLICQATIQRT